MTIILNELFDFNCSVFRNIQGVGFDEFDDLSDDPKARVYAHKLARLSEPRFGVDEVQYHAIDYIFKRKSWLPSRFSNGSYPVWYGTIDLETGFYETLYHWQRTFLEAPLDFTRISEGPILATRTVFKVACQAALIDLRNKADQNTELVNPDPACYPQAQQIGQRVNQEGHPGLITPSARQAHGENVVIFKKEILKVPVHYNDYIYEYDLQNRRKIVKQLNTQVVVLEI